MLFPAPPRPELPAGQATVTEEFLRYEDVTQDGHLMPIAVPPAMAGLWRDLLERHPGAKNAAAGGVIPILTRLTIESMDEHVRVDRPVEARSGFELARKADGSRLFMNVWCDLFATAGRIVPRTPAGPLVLAGRLFSEHTFTRPFAPPEQRRVTRLDAEGYPAIPDKIYAAPAPVTAQDAPDGARWLGELQADGVETVFSLDHTDSNQHVNSLVYVRLFLEAAQRRIAAAGHPTRVRSRAFDIAYRKPCFAGDRVQAQVRLFERAGTLGAAGALVDADGKPRCYVRAIVGP